MFDGEELKLPFCKDTYCTYEEFSNYLLTNLYFDHEFVDNYCSGKIEEETENELKFTRIHDYSWNDKNEEINN